MGRRPDGALERDVLTVLWRAERPLTPAEVRGQLDADLAYTTVMTVLTRLNEKGLTVRSARGRAFAYAPTVSESELVAKRMKAELSVTKDRTGALAGFVGGLNRRDLAALRRVLDEGGA